MKKALFAILLAALGSAQASVYHFSLTDGNRTVTGSFEGTASGNLISDLSNISVSMDGVDYQGNGSLYTAQLVKAGDSYYWGTGAVASFDGAENNFLFINKDYLAGDRSYNAYFYSIAWLGQSLAQDWHAGNYNNYMVVNGVPSSANWTVSEVPEPGSLTLLGLGVAGLAAGRRRKQ